MEKIKDWLDNLSISVETAAKIFGKSEGTIRNWRSLGVPASQRKWVGIRCREWEQQNQNIFNELPELPDRLTLEPSKEEFDAWNRAALKSGKIVREWAMDALTELAEEESGLYSARHAEVPLVREDSTGSGYAPNPVESQEDRDRFQNGTDKQEGSGAA